MCMDVFRGSTPSVYPAIIRYLQDLDEQDSRAGGTREQMMVAVQSTDPRERWLDRKEINWAFGLQECFAYWNGLNPGHVERYNSQMEEYMYDGKLHGSAYGRYLRHIPHDQIERVLSMLSESPSTRRAVINIHQASVEDYDGPDVACTIYLHPFIRDDELHMVANLRSQDMLWGYPYDTHAFQWIQELLAGCLKLDVGDYWHVMNSCHYYTDYEDRVFESARDCGFYSMPDARIDYDDMNLVMSRLGFGLSVARKGWIPSGHVQELEEAGYGFYADWLRMMTTYEQQRFYGALQDAADEMREEISVRAFSDWLKG